MLVALKYKCSLGKKNNLQREDVFKCEDAQTESSLLWRNDVRETTFLRVCDAIEAFDQKACRSRFCKPQKVSRLMSLSDLSERAFYPFIGHILIYA